MKRVLLLLCFGLMMPGFLVARNNSSNSGTVLDNLATASRPGIYTWQTAPGKQQPAPQEPEKVEEKKAPKIKMPDPKLWKSLQDFVKFRKKADKKLDAKIQAKIKGLGLKDSATAKAEYIKLLALELKKRKHPNFDSLQHILQTLIKQQAAAKPGEAPTTAEAAANPPVDMETLAALLVPMLEQKEAEAKTNKAKNEQTRATNAKIRLLNQVKNAGPDTVYQVKEGKVTKRFRLSLKHNTEVYGFYNGDDPSDVSAFLNSATALVYYALEVNETTGALSDKTNWATSPAVEKAQKAEAKVYFTVLIANKTGKSPLLYNQAARQSCIRNILATLKQGPAQGVHIRYTTLAKRDKPAFSAFMKELATALQTESRRYALFLTIPRSNINGTYDLDALKPYVTKFFIDFTTNVSSIAGPLAPLEGNTPETIDAVFTWYSSQGLDASQMVLLLPYKGTRWLVNTETLITRFAGYKSFKAIRKEFGNSEGYDAETESVSLEHETPKKQVYRIWFDNAASFSKKYDFIVKNKLGVGLYFINDDDPTYELNNELIYKLTDIDTTYLKTPVAPPTPPLTFLERQLHYLVLWNYILQNPCATCFENSNITPEKKALVRTYLADLNIDSLVWQEKISKNKAVNQSITQPPGKVTITEKFTHLNRKLNNLLKYLSLFFLVASFSLILFYIYGIKYYSGDWKYKKETVGILLGVFTLFVFFGFTYCFTSDLIPLFGIADSSAGTTECTVDPTCINIPYNVLLLVIFISILLGSFYFYLVNALVKKDNLP